MDTNVEPQTITLSSGEVVVAGQIVMFNGHECKVSKNGALYDLVEKRFVAPPAPAFALTPISSSEQGRDVAGIRWHKPRQDAILQAVREATGDEAGELYKELGDADGYLTKEMLRTIVLDDSGNTRGADRVKAWEAVLEHSGMSGKAPKAAQQQPAEAEVQWLRGTLDKIVAAAMAAAERKQGDG